MLEEPSIEIPIKVRLSEAMRARLASNAASAGKSLPDYLSMLVQLFIIEPRDNERTSDSLYRNFVASGISDDELSDVLEKAKHEMRDERRARRPA